MAAVLTLLSAGPLHAVDELDYGLDENLLYKIVFNGNSHFDDDQLKANLRIREPRKIHPLLLLGLSDRTARYQPHLLDVEMKLLERFYNRNGFQQATVRLDSVSTDPLDRGDVIHIGIDEGRRTYIEAVDFFGPAPFEPEDLMEDLRYKAGVPAPGSLNQLGEDIYNLRLKYWERGYLKVEIRPEMINAITPDTTAFHQRLIYDIHSGSAYTIGRIRLEGNETTRSDLILDALRLRSGDVFRWSAVEESQLRLLETAMFRDVAFVPADIDTVAGTTDMLVKVVERKPAYYEFGFGVGSRERIRLLTAWGHNNIFGTGQRLRLRARNYLNYEDVQRLSDGTADYEHNYRYDITHSRPRMFGNLQLDTSLFADKETRGESGLNLKTWGFSFGTRFGGGRRTINLMTLRLEQVDPSLHPDAIPPLRDAFESSDLRSSGTHSLGWNFYDERRDNPMRPTTGAMRNILVECAGGPLGGDNSFLKSSASLHRYFKMPVGVLAVRFSAGVVRPYGGSLDRGSDGVPYQERFFAGGVSTVRGYLERSLGPQITDQAVLDSLQLTSDVPLPDRPARGGNYMMLSNMEWRFPLPLLSRWGLDGVAFFDGGNVWEHASDIQLKGFRLRSYPRDPQDDDATKLWDYRYSLGWGLRVGTPVGPVRIDVGYPLKRAQLSDTLKEDKVIYHFSLGYPF